MKFTNQLVPNAVSRLAARLETENSPMLFVLLQWISVNIEENVVCQVKRRDQKESYHHLLLAMTSSALISTFKQAPAFICMEVIANVNSCFMTLLSVLSVFSCSIQTTLKSLINKDWTHKYSKDKFRTFKNNNVYIYKDKDLINNL